MKRERPQGNPTPTIPALPPRWRPRLPGGMALLLAVSSILFGAVWLLDTAYFGRRAPAAAGLGPWRLLVELDAETLQNTLGSLAQVVVAVLGIAITVVSIVVQLAATRYTPRIAEMFFRDKKNLAIMGFFVVSCINAAWISIVVTGNFVPRLSVAVTTVMVTASLLVLIPYFTYVFAFLDPEKVIARIGLQVLDAVLGRRTFRRQRADVDLRQAGCAAGLEHLADVAINTAAQKDKIIATDAVTALREFAVKYLKTKQGLSPDWFVLGERVHGNPDFIALAADSQRALERKQTWVEWTVLRHYRSIFTEALEHLPELGHVVAIETRYIGEEALRLGDHDVVVLVTRYFNTYMRTAINHANIRTAYNVSHQYRLLAEHMLRKGEAAQVVELGRCFAYYAHLARRAGLGFVTETIAHDLGVLCERAFEHAATCHDALLGVFLDIDKQPESGAEEQTPRGIRKAQVKLATFYLAHGADAAADRICADLRGEKAERLGSIKAELLAVSDREFWEVTDRGVNFDFLDDARKEELDQVFARAALR